MDLEKSNTFKLKLQSTIYNTPSCHNSGAKEKVSGAERRRRKIREGGMKEEEVEGWIREKGRCRRVVKDKRKSKGRG